MLFYLLNNNHGSEGYKMGDPQVGYYFQMCSIILDQKENYNEEATQNMHFVNMDNSNLIFDQVIVIVNILIQNSRRSTKMVVFLTLSAKLSVNYIIHHIFGKVHHLELSIPLEIPPNVYLILL